jgi:hypothetical protein
MIRQLVLFILVSTSCTDSEAETDGSNLLGAVLLQLGDDRVNTLLSLADVLLDVSHQVELGS